MPPELGLNKFQERLSGASGIQKNLLATALGELAALPYTISGGNGASFPLPKNPIPLSAL